MDAITRRWIIAVPASIAATAVVTGTTHASEFPDRPVRQVVGFAPGGGTDFAARLIGNSLSKMWGKGVIAENKPGADGSIAALEVSKSKPDGYNLLFTTTALTISSIMQEQGFNPVTMLEPVALLGTNPTVLVVNSDVPARSVKELVDYAKAKPGSLNYGSGGTGTIMYLAGGMFLRETGTSMVHVPYKGGEQAVLGLLGGDVQVMFNGVSPVLPYLKSGKLRALAVSSAARNSLIPDVPTFIESGLPGFNTATWYGVFAAPGTPKEIIQVLNAAYVKAMRMPEIQAALERQGFDVVGGSADAMGAIVKADMVAWPQVIQSIK